MATPGDHEERTGRGPESGSFRPGPDLFENQELSRLALVGRMLDEARQRGVPLLSRFAHLCDAWRELDELYLARVAALLLQVREDVRAAPPDGASPREQLERVVERTRAVVGALGAAWIEDFAPAFGAQGASLVRPEELDARERERLRHHFVRRVQPILTPLVLDPAHPFPRVAHRTLVLAVDLRRESGDEVLGLVQIPGVLARLVPVGDAGGRSRFVLLEHAVAAHAGDLFRGLVVEGAWPFRVVRDLDLPRHEGDADDLLEPIDEHARHRDRGAVLRLDVAARMASGMAARLARALDVPAERVFAVRGPLAPQDLGALERALGHRPDLTEEPFEPTRSPAFRAGAGVVEVLDRRDVLLHHPYESFGAVVSFLDQAADDPEVLAIKHTFPQSSGGGLVADALARAARRGAQVVAVVELGSRLLAPHAVPWVRAMEDAGVQVAHGLYGLETHAHVTLVVRRAGDGLRGYARFGTGDQGHTAGRPHTDVSLLTADAELAEDAQSLFLLLTSCAAPREWKKLTVAPLGLHERVLGLVEREAAYARAGRPARILAKMEALSDQDVIHALYRASQAGVETDLLVRGVCCLRPGIPGVSERIRVTGIVDRFVEHSRLFYFEAGGRREVYAATADWTATAFHRRVEVMFPIEAEAEKQRVLDEILRGSLEDDVKASRLGPDGAYERLAPLDPASPRRSQARFVERARRAAERAKRESSLSLRPVAPRTSSDPEDGRGGEGA